MGFSLSEVACFTKSRADSSSVGAVASFASGLTAGLPVVAASKR